MDPLLGAVGALVGFYLTVWWLIRAILKADFDARRWLPIPRWLRTIGDL